MAEAAPPPWAEPLGGGVWAIDTGFQRPGFDAAYLVVERGRAAFVDSGTNFALPRLLGLLDALGLARDAVDMVIPTHVHLDHAGGAGALMRELPAATLWVHPRGARHMIDPQRVYEGALAIYGQAEMDRSYGRPVPVPAARLRETADGMVLDLAGRRLVVADTPGHAKHHHCIWDEATRGWFTGDTFGFGYREFDTAAGAWIAPTTTPVQFDPQALRDSVERLLAARPERMYITHFGAVGDVPRLGELFLAHLEAMVAIARAAPAGPARHEAMTAALRNLYVGSLRRHGCTQTPAALAALLAIDIELNAQGMGVWLDRGR